MFILIIFLSIFSQNRSSRNSYEYLQTPLYTPTIDTNRPQNQQVIDNINRQNQFEKDSQARIDEFNSIPNDPLRVLYESNSIDNKIASINYLSAFCLINHDDSATKCDNEYLPIIKNQATRFNNEDAYISIKCASIYAYYSNFVSPKEATDFAYSSVNGTNKINLISCSIEMLGLIEDEKEEVISTLKTINNEIENERSRQLSRKLCLS